MAFLTATEMTAPGGIPWEWLILTVFNFIVDYGWRIVLFTLLLKLLLYPLDIFQRYKMRKNQKITQRLQPELDKLQKAYANDPQTLQQKQMELNKREGYSYMAACLPAIVTLVIFIWFFASLNNISQYMIMRQYVEWCDIYDNTYAEYIDENYPNYDALDADAKQGAINAATDKAQTAVFEFYHGENGNKESFLWIKNIWSPDVPWRTPILAYNDFKSAVAGWGTDTATSGIDEDKLAEIMSEQKYGVVTEKLYNDEENAANGYLLLPILAAGLSFLSQFISMRQQKKSGMAQAGGSMTFMMFLFPILMIFFSVGYTSAFALYIVMNSGVTVLLNLLSSAIFGIKDKREAVIAANTVVRYGRPDPNDKLRGGKTDGTVRYGRPDPHERTNNNDGKKGK